MIRPDTGCFRPLIAKAGWLALVLSCAACVPQGQGRQDDIAHNIAPPEPQKPQKKTEKNTLDKAGSIATQPVRDVGVNKKEIPPVLEKAAQSAYALPKSRKCSALSAELIQLNAVLGPDYADAEEQKKENRAGKLAEAGGKMVVNSLIPFRGLVREISGAAPAKRRMQSAIAAGLARRGFLRGLAKARRCRITSSAG